MKLKGFAPKALRLGERMPQLYFTDLAVLRCPAIVDGVTHELLMPTAAAAEATGLSDGMPFILDERGGYEVDLNRFFRACPTMGVRSSNSLRAYARDLLVWMRFLCERRGSKPIWQADREDVAAYHARAADQRRFTASPPPHGTALWRHWRSSMFGQSKKS
jgi:hypothetical protein